MTKKQMTFDEWKTAENKGVLPICDCGGSNGDHGNDCAFNNAEDNLINEYNQYVADLEPMIPTVHLNGTGGKALLEQYKTAMKDLRTAIGSMRMAMPHGRDYYLQGDDVGTTARVEHEARISSLEAAYDDMQEIAKGIYKQTV